MLVSRAIKGAHTVYCNAAELRKERGVVHAGDMFDEESNKGAEDYSTILPDTKYPQKAHKMT